jgi:hypothetical protein
MPYFIKKDKTGFKVCKIEEPNKCFSKDPMPLQRAQKQLKAIGISASKGGSKTKKLKSLFGRIGGKSKLKKKIVDGFFPNNYENMSYVEAFVGGASIYFYKKPSIKEIINDKDSDVIELLKGFKKYD